MIMKITFKKFVLTLVIICLSANHLAAQRKPIIYDKSIPAHQTCTLVLVHDCYFSIKKFNEKTVRWRSVFTEGRINYAYSQDIIIPAGTHDFVVDYSKPLGNNQYQTATGLTVRHIFQPGHEYVMYAEIDDQGAIFGQFVKAVIEDAVVLEEKKAKIEEDKKKKWAMEEAERKEFLSSLPEHSTKPTLLQGGWKIEVQNLRKTLLFIGNTWTYNSDGPFLSSPVYGEYGLFIIDGTTLKVYLTEIKEGERPAKTLRGAGFKPISDYKNAVSEYNFVFEADGRLRLRKIKGNCEIPNGTYDKEPYRTINE